MNDRLERVDASLARQLRESIERNSKLRTEFDKATRLVSQSIQWQRDAEIKIAKLKAQLPEGMEHCTIQFKECEKGHGWLTATNWVDHGCPWCEIEQLREERDARLPLAAVVHIKAVTIEECAQVAETTWDHDAPIAAIAAAIRALGNKKGGTG